MIKKLNFLDNEEQSNKFNDDYSGEQLKKILKNQKKIFLIFQNKF